MTITIAERLADWVRPPIVTGANVSAPRLVIAAGLGSRQLARGIDIQIPLRPQRGQVLVTERIAKPERLSPFGATRPHSAPGPPTN